MRCTSEMFGVHPVGGIGVGWTAELFNEAQDWCLAQENCTGIMLFVGQQSVNCHQWCGRPQFCSELITDDEGFEKSADWNLYVRGNSTADEVTVDNEGPGAVNGELADNNTPP